MWGPLLSLSVMFLRFIYVVARISTSFPFMAEQYSIVWMYHILFIYSSVDRPLSYFYFLIIVNSVSINTGILVFVWTLV